MRLHRPVLLALALGTVLPVTAASAATGVAAAGSAVSSATLVTLSVGDLTVAGTTIQGHEVSMATLSAVAQTLSNDAPAVSFVPVTVDGVTKGAITVTPANSPQSVGAVTTGALPLGVLSASSPSATLTAAKAATGPVSKVTASLGEASVLGLPLSLKGGLNVGSATDNAKAQAGKTLTITDVSLPNLSDLLAALGIDIGELPVDTLNALIEELDVAISAAAETALAAANAALEAGDGAYEALLAQQATAAATLASTAGELDSQLGSATIPALDLSAFGVTTPVNHADWDALGATEAGQAVQDAIVAANPLDTELTAAITAYEAAKTAFDAVKAQVASALAAIQPLIDDVAGIVDGVLATNPLVSIDAAQIGTDAVAGSKKAANVTGYVSGVKVLGNDILATATGNTKVDLAKLSGEVAGKVNAALADVTSTLSSVLSSVTGATGLVVPAPSVKVMQKQTSTGTDGAFGTANAVVTALQVDLGSATIPDAFALANAAELPAILPTSTGFKTAPLSIKVGQLGEAARFRPGSAAPATPTKPTTPNKGSLPATGGPVGLAMIAAIGTALAFGARRMARSEG